MTTNFGGCEERSTMASAHKEDRHLLRRLAWEQRNQETSQAKESNCEIVPLFGEPYKTNKGDELSNRIQRMLGCYEEYNIPSPVAVEPLPIPSQGTPLQSDCSEPSADLQAKPAPLSEVRRAAAASQSQKGPSGSSHAPQASQASTPLSPNRHMNTSSSSSANPGPPPQQQQQQQMKSYLREHADLFQGVSSQSPDDAAAAASESLPCPYPVKQEITESSPCLHSVKQEVTESSTCFHSVKQEIPESSPCLHSVKQEVIEPHTADRHQPEGPKHFPGAADVPTFNPKQSPKDLPVLPAQTFSSLLSKQPSVVMTQKPTAYVRPMDGQDQVVSESPELKPSPEPYAPLPELINKTEPDKEKMPPQYSETPADDMCVESIIREMTLPWPTAIETINSPAPPSPTNARKIKEAQDVSSHPVHKEFLTSPADSSRHMHERSSSSFEVAHSRVGESPSSSDSESSSRSESDGESVAEGRPPNPGNISVKTVPDAPEAIQVDWQLGNWIRSGPQKSGTQGPRSSHPSQSPAHKQPERPQCSTRAGLKEAEPTKGRKRPQKRDKPPQDFHKPQSNRAAPPAGPSECSRKHLSAAASSKAAKADCADAALVVKQEDVAVAAAVAPVILDGHKAKTKTRHRKKNKEKGDDQRESSTSSKHKSRAKEKGAAPEPKAASAAPAGCPSCGVRYPNPCSCPAPPGQQPLLSPLKVACSKPKSANQKPTSKSPHRTAQKPRAKPGQDAQGPRGAQATPPKALTVKIDLSLLSRVPQISGNHRGRRHRHQEAAAAEVEEEGEEKAASKAKRSKDPGGAGSRAPAAHKPTKTSRKPIPPHVEVDSNVPRKKPRLENGCASPSRASAKPEVSAEEPARKKAKKEHLRKDSKSHRGTTGDVGESGKDAHKKKDSREKKRSRSGSGSGKLAGQPQSGKEIPKSSSSSLRAKESAASRTPLKSEDAGQLPVTHYIKEAKKLKHKADAERDRSRKAFSYLEAAMYFVESGIAMEKDPQIYRSSSTMFADTMDLLRFVLVNVVEATPPPPEKDFLKVLCLKCQSLLHMAMFHQKHKTALKYSKTLTSHFNNSDQKTPNPTVLTQRVSETPSPLSSMPSPAIASNSGSLSEPGSSGGGSASLPVAIQQTVFSYVSITALFLNAHDMWEQAEEVAPRAGGMLRELDAAEGPLSLASSMVSMVRYTRQAVSWLRLHSQKGK